MPEAMQQLNNGSELQGGKYRILGLLGQGGYGITYLAQHTLLDKKVAIKEFFPREYCDRDGSTSHVTLGTSSNRELIDRLRTKFVKEARNLARLNNPGIVKIYDVFEENSTAYYVMEWIDGPSLADVVKERERLDEAEAVKYVSQVGDALTYVHSHSITHLDVKPANIMVRCEDDHAVLIDFGLSKQYNESGGQTSTTPIGISHGYAPIEQYRPDGMNKFSPETDVYALAATLYKLITGINPPQAIELLENPLEFPDYVSPVIAEAITKAMAPTKVARTKTVDAFIKAIHGGAQPEVPAVPEVPTEVPVQKVEPAVADEPTEVPAVPSAPAKTKKKPVTEVTEIVGAKVAPKQKEPTPATTPAPRKKSSGKTIALVAVVAALLGVGVFFLVKSAPGSSDDDDFIAEEEVEAVDSVNAADSVLLADASIPGGATKDVPEPQQPKEEPKQPAATPAPAPAATPAPAPAATPAPQPAQTTQGGASAAELYKQGVEAFNNENYAQAVSLYRQAADKGSAAAQYSLGECYYRGWGVGKSAETAVTWFRKAALQGLAKAQNQLGDCYRYGNGVSSNHDEARRWYGLAAAQGHRSAERSLADLGN